MVDAIKIAMMLLILGALVLAVRRLGALATSLHVLARPPESTAAAVVERAQEQEKRRDTRAAAIVREIRDVGGALVKELRAAARDRREMLQYVRGSEHEAEPAGKPATPVPESVSAEPTPAHSSTRWARGAASRLPTDAPTPPAGFLIPDIATHSGREPCA